MTATNASSTESQHKKKSTPEGVPKKCFLRISYHTAPNITAKDGKENTFFKSYFPSFTIKYSIYGVVCVYYIIK